MSRSDSETAQIPERSRPITPFLDNPPAIDGKHLDIGKMA